MVGTRLPFQPERMDLEGTRKIMTQGPCLRLLGPVPVIFAALNEETHGQRDGGMAQE